MRAARPLVQIKRYWERVGQERVTKRREIALVDVSNRRFRFGSRLHRRFAC